MPLSRSVTRNFDTPFGLSLAKATHRRKSAVRQAHRERVLEGQEIAFTGFPIGGVPPFGHLTHLAVFIDPDLLQYDEVWAAAGTWTHVFGIEPHKLLEASEGLVTDLKRS